MPVDRFLLPKARVQVPLLLIALPQELGCCVMLMALNKSFNLLHYDDT